ncbi:hypothetical protein [Gulosibacter sediminis]|uniref:hypothetical protein n=1 Tax=Gulosibacter sediminis TaxID=1729695 RepID=UPI001866FA78|nr:hypothetical protein [Gulosibacter sediminis]
MSGSREPEYDPNLKWYERGGYTTMAAMGLVLGLICALALLAGWLFSQLELARLFVPYPATIGLIFSILGVLGPWKLAAVSGGLLCLDSVAVAMLLG